MSAPQKCFELVLTRKTNAVLLLIGGTLLLVFACIQLIAILTLHFELSKSGGLSLILALFGLGAFIIYRLVKKYASLPMLVTVEADKITFSDSVAGSQQLLLFNDIATYRVIDFNHTIELRLKLKDGSKSKFWLHDFFHNEQYFREMVTAFETALSTYLAQLPANELRATMREKTLFDKLLSTFLLVPFTGFMVWATWEHLVGKQRSSGPFFSAWSIYLAYLTAWYAARGQRRSAEQ